MKSHYIGALAALLMLLVRGSSVLESAYTITQYGDDESAQQMFYTIESPKGELIVVDGGYASEEVIARVREVVLDKGNVVDTWILTHPHPDHIGAFNKIYADPQGMKIQEIFASDIDYDLYKQNSRPWDDFDTFEEFLSITEGDPRVKYLHENDEISIAGLGVKVLNAANTWRNDPANGGSLVLRMQAKQQSMLFLGDAGAEVSEPLMQNHKEDLKVDVVQMAHHANGGVTDEVYAWIAPTIAFADCPHWLRTNLNPQTGEPGRWTTPERIALMESMGAEVLSFDTAPNVIKIQ